MYVSCLGELLDDGVRNFAHGQAAVHGGLLNPAECFRLSQVHLGDEQRLCAVNELAGLELVADGANFLLESANLLVAADCHLDCGVPSG